MRTPAALFRIVLIAAAAQLATACTSTQFAQMNPFDGDPNGPPPAPVLWDGAYAGDQPNGPHYTEDKPARVADRPSKPTRVASAEGRSDYDRSYGTNKVESGELPPPSDRPAGAVASNELEDATPAPFDEDRRDAPRASRDDNRDSGTRTLTTTRSRDASASAGASTSSITYKVKKGEELSDIADSNGVREVDIIKLNNLKPPYTLKAGQELQIPTREVGAAPSDGDYVTAGDVAVPRAKPDMDGGRTDAKPAREKETASADGPRFDWPVSGKVISNFGAAGDGLYNEGINIAVPKGTPVRASASGTVRYAGNELRGYGNLVLIEHAGGYVTAYAHNDSLKVKRGDKVSRGDVIALSGQTGNVKSPQVHFEIRKGTESVDPRKHLVAMAN